MRVSKWWHNFYLLVNYPFKLWLFEGNKQFFVPDSHSYVGLLSIKQAEIFHPTALVASLDKLHCSVTFYLIGKCVPCGLNVTLTSRMDNLSGAAGLDLQMSAVLKCWLQRDFRVISLLAHRLSVSISLNHWCCCDRALLLWDGSSGSQGPSQWRPILSISSMLSH